MSGRRVVLGLLIALVMASHVEADPIPPPTAQAQFDTAEAAYERSDWAAAIAGFEKVLPPDTGSAPTHNQALIRSRLADAYLNAARLDDARASARIALRGLTNADGADLVSAWMTLGDVDLNDTDMAEAVEAYRHVVALSAGPDGAETRIDAERKLALAAMVTNPNAAADALDAALADQPYVSTLPILDRARLEDLRGRAELNLGDAKGALKILDRAITDSGGLDSPRINLIQAAIRGDAAIAAQLTHDGDNLHRYIAASAAGDIQTDAWIGAAEMEPPVCDVSLDMLPTDTAVIEFSIDPQGRVERADPIYASRPGPMGLEFAAAVRRWRWSPAAVVGLNPFWRDTIRIQIGCREEPAPITLYDDFVASTQAWLLSKGAGAGDVALLTNHSVSIADTRLQRNDAIGLAAMIAVEQTPGTGGPDLASRAKLDQVMNSLDAPADVRALVIYTRSRHAASTAGNREYARSQATWNQFQSAWANTRAAAWLDVEQAYLYENMKEYKNSSQILKSVVDRSYQILPEKDPIRLFAILHLAMIDMRLGQQVKAKAELAAAAIKPGQCSLMDIKPLASSQPMDNWLFPEEAQKWGLGGYVRVAFNITTDGRVSGVRTVLAYPPFIFDDSSTSTVSHFRYIAPSVGGAPVGCADDTVSFKFQHPSS